MHPERIRRVLTPCLTGWLAGWLVFAGTPPASAQEPVVEPLEEAAVEPAEDAAIEPADAAADPSGALADPPERVARLSLIEGEVSVASEAESESWAAAELNRPLTRGDKVWVEHNARAELQTGASTLHLAGGTGVSFIELDADVMQASLTEGAVSIRVRRLSERETIQVETPHATVFLRRPGEYYLEVDAAGDRTVVKARGGEAEVVGRNRSYRVHSNQQGVFTGLEDLEGEIERVEARTAFESWANDRERRAARSNSSRYVSEEVVGYEDLDDHGEWLYEREYGHVWRPRIVSHDWAPYRDGRWAWIRPWGWTWIDHARWGFAPFHYGRWAYLRQRWCWVPGPRHLRPVYAPALVGWIGRPSVSLAVSVGDSVGWFPLAPHEIYVPAYRHTPRYIRHVNVSNTVIVNNTHITNIYAGRGHPGRYRHRDAAHAVTAVHRDRFVGGRPVAGDRVRFDDRELRGWRDRTRPPGVEQREHRAAAGESRRGRQRDFDDDRNPKERGDFRSERQHVVGGGGKRGEQERERREAAARRSAGGNARPAERTEIPRGEGEPQALRRRDHMYRPPARALQATPTGQEAQRGREAAGTASTADTDARPRSRAPNPREWQRREPVQRPLNRDQGLRDQGGARAWRDPSSQQRTGTAAPRAENDRRESRRHESGDHPAARSTPRAREAAQPSPQRRTESNTRRAEAAPRQHTERASQSRATRGAAPRSHPRSQLQ